MTEPRYKMPIRPRPNIPIQPIADVSQAELAASDRAATEAGFHHRPVLPPPAPRVGTSAAPSQPSPYTRKRRLRTGTYSGPTEQLAMRVPYLVFDRFVSLANEMELTYAQALEYLMDQVAPETPSERG